MSTLFRVYIEHDGKQAQESAPTRDTAGVGLCWRNPGIDALEGYVWARRYRSAKAKIMLINFIDRRAARNTVRCALWGLKPNNMTRSSQIACLSYPNQIVTADHVDWHSEAMATRRLRDYVANGAKLLKVKLDGEQVVEACSRGTRNCSGIFRLYGCQWSVDGLNLEGCLIS